MHPVECRSLTAVSATTKTVCPFHSSHFDISQHDKHRIMSQPFQSASMHKVDQGPSHQWALKTQKQTATYEGQNKATHTKTTQNNMQFDATQRGINFGRIWRCTLMQSLCHYLADASTHTRSTAWSSCKKYLIISILIFIRGKSLNLIH